MSDQVAVLESIRDVLSGKVSNEPTKHTTPEDEEEILDLTKLVNDDGSITDLDSLANQSDDEPITTESIKEEEMANVSISAGDDVLDEIDRLLADETSGEKEEISKEAEETIDEMLEPINPISDESLDIELAEESKPEVTEFETNDSAINETTENEEIMTENNNPTDEFQEDSLLSDASADKAKSSIADLLKVTGQNKAAKPSTPAPSFRNGDTLEDLVMESLKPMLAKWLDENLNSLVEEIVQKEISRIIPK